MLLLAIDTSGRNGSIALARAETDDSPDELEIVEIMPLAGGTFSAQLIPQISTLISSNGYNKDAIGALAVVSGPGSFTGLRVGLAAVQALSEVLKKPVAALSLLEVCVFASGAKGKVTAALDAGRGDIYMGSYDLPAQAGSVPRESMVTASEFLAQAKGSTVVTPDSELGERLKSAGLTVQLIAPITAANVAYLGWQKIGLGQTVTADQLEANYIRRTDAELLEKVRS